MQPVVPSLSSRLKDTQQLISLSRKCKVLAGNAQGKPVSFFALGALFVILSCYGNFSG